MSVLKFFSIDCDAVFEVKNLALTDIKSFGILKTKLKSLRSETNFESLKFELYTKRVDSEKLIFDHKVFVFYGNESNSTGQGFRVTSLECFKDLSETLLASRDEHKVLALENSRLKLVSILAEIRIVQEEAVFVADSDGFVRFGERRKRSVEAKVSLLKRFDQALKRFSEIVLGKVAIIENAIGKKLQSWTS
jgi:hypothetical protein